MVRLEVGDLFTTVTIIVIVATGKLYEYAQYMALHKGLHRDHRFYDRFSSQRYGYICEIYKWNLDGDPKFIPSIAASKTFGASASAFKDVETPTSS